MKILLKYLFPNPDEQLFIADATSIDFAIYKGFYQEKFTDLFLGTKVVISLKFSYIGKANHPSFSRYLENLFSNKTKEFISLPDPIAELSPQNAHLIIDGTLRTKAAGFLKVGNIRPIKIAHFPTKIIV